MSKHERSHRPSVFLVGAGVVGRAIVRAHTDADVSVCVADQNVAFVREAVAGLSLDPEQWQVSEPTEIGNGLPAIELTHVADSRPNSSRPNSGPIVIESISERLETKRDFFRSAEDHFGADAILCSNTSTLRISTIADTLARPERFCGMHFFMPVYNRPAVEVIGGNQTSAQTIASCIDHVRRIGKDPLVVGDGPGFVVNRLLSPYLNEAMLLLGRGISAEQIERAALRYGMPMSPLELIDWIGTGTMFDAGRVYWQAFPTRIRPSPMLSALVKNKRLGRACGAGLYDYDDGVRSTGLSPVTMEYCQSYSRDEMVLDDDDVMRVLSIPMWIEAAIAYQDGIVESREQFNLAMRGGLGFDSNRSWLEFFESLGSKTILEAIEKWSSVTPCMNSPEELRRLLSKSTPTVALEQLAAQ